MFSQLRVGARLVDTPTDVTICSADRGTSTTPTFQYTSGAFRDDHLQNIVPEECGSPGSEFSLTHEWHHMLEAGTAAGMSTRDSSANNSEYENPYEVLNGFELDLGSSPNSICRAHAQVVRKPSRTRSMELPRVSHVHYCLASGQLKDEKIQLMAKHITTLPRHSAPLMNHEQRQDVNYGNHLNVSLYLSFSCFMILYCEVREHLHRCDRQYIVVFSLLYECDCYVQIQMILREF